MLAMLMIQSDAGAGITRHNVHNVDRPRRRCRGRRADAAGAVALFVRNPLVGGVLSSSLEWYVQYVMLLCYALGNMLCCYAVVFSVFGPTDSSRRPRSSSSVLPIIEIID